MASYQRKLDELGELGATVIGATVEDRDTATRMAEEVGLTFPIAYGLTEEGVSGLAPWWADDRHGRYLQPMEFIILRRGIVFCSMYASGPIGRMAVDEVIDLLRRRESGRLRN